MKRNLETVPDDAKGSFNFSALIIWAAAIFCAYVLSVGPAIILVKKGRIGFMSLGIYRPVEWLYQNTPAHKPIGMYLHLWDPDDFDKSGRPI